MARKAKFYLKRVNKLGGLDSAGIIDAIMDAEQIMSGKFAWTALSPVRETLATDRAVAEFAGAVMVKYDKNAEVEVVDEKLGKVVIKSEPDMIEARSQFVYLPDLEVVAFKNVWNHIPPKTFASRFSDLVRAFHEDFFVDLELTSIADSERFHRRVAKLEAIDSIRAKIRPSNPLFSRYWKSLDDYAKRRSSKIIEIAESSEGAYDLESDVPRLALTAGESGDRTDADPIRDPRAGEVGFSDAAVMMAADGYGTASVYGREDGENVVIRTDASDTILELDGDVSLHDLAEEAIVEAERINARRGLSH